MGLVLALRLGGARIGIGGVLYKHSDMLNEGVAMTFPCAYYLISTIIGDVMFVFRPEVEFEGDVFAVHIRDLGSVPFWTLFRCVIYVLDNCFHAHAIRCAAVNAAKRLHAHILQDVTVVNGPRAEGVLGIRMIGRDVVLKGDGLLGKALHATELNTVAHLNANATMH
jgi:hypothetical protein